MILSFVVILFLLERGLNKRFTDYWLKDLLIWEKLLAQGYADLGERFWLCVFGKGD